MSVSPQKAVGTAEAASIGLPISERAAVEPFTQLFPQVFPERLKR